MVYEVCRAGGAAEQSATSLLLLNHRRVFLVGALFEHLEALEVSQVP